MLRFKTASTIHQKSVPFIKSIRGAALNLYVQIWSSANFIEHNSQGSVRHELQFSKLTKNEFGLYNPLMTLDFANKLTKNSAIF